MADPTGGHAAFVAAWFERAAEGGAPVRPLDLLERACEALWARVRPTLGEATLAAVAERAFHDAAERFPVFESVEVGLGGVYFEGPRAQAGELRAGDLEAAARFALVGLLTVIGHLTAEVLTPALYAALAGVVSEVAVEAQGGKHGLRHGRGQKRGAS